MDLYQILMQDHRTIKEIFIEIEQTDDREVERREQLCEKLRTALEGHTVIEETLFYPEIDKYPAIKELVAEAYDEHVTFDEILREISELSTNKIDWMERIKELGDSCRNMCARKRIRCFPRRARNLTRAAPRNSDGKSSR